MDPPPPQFSEVGGGSKSTPRGAFKKVKWGGQKMKWGLVEPPPPKPPDKLNTVYICI